MRFATFQLRWVAARLAIMPDPYPINDFGPVMKGLAIGGLGIFHVFLAQFAIGGGLLMCYFQWLAQTKGDKLARQFTDGFFKFLVLVSFVVGAITGVGMWFTSIQVSARTIGLMVHHFHWIWAIEWTFFCLEIASGYLFYRYGTRLPDRVRMTLLVAYAVAAWFSLFWINGILSWQLTPGAWEQSHSIWAGFFNPSFWPSLVFRTVVAMTIAALVACVVANFLPNLERSQREELVHKAARFLIPMVLMPFLAVWYFLAIPADSRSWVLGGSAAMSLFFALGAGASLLVGAYALFGLVRQQLFVNGATALLLVSLAFAATAGGEFVREGVRKPFSIRHLLYSNSIKEDEAARLRQRGCTTDDPYPLRNPEQYPDPQLAKGAQVYRNLCSVCHTVHGTNALTDLTSTWSPDQMRINIAKLQRTKPFMPPFAGNAEEVEALVQFLRWESQGRPAEWEATASNPAVIAQIDTWLAEAGTQSGLSLLDLRLKE
ncbi:MAG TPA: cytochrome ubiquinol oxidase subunit I [Pirellulaceae bacterium]|nr:cytochrome ubiquinol oxidase subunit I [Pirellulaceae bacterium]